MSIARLVVTGTALLVVGGCTDAHEALGPAASRPAAASAQAAQQVDAAGQFDALVDFSTLTLTPKGSNCLIVVKGQLVFTGTIEGVANGTTSALVKATCAEVASAPPGTYPDVFHSDLEFQGTVNGVPVEADGMYAGRSEPGGAIDGRLVFSNGMAGRLDVVSQIAVGGTYEGAVVVH